MTPVKTDLSWQEFEQLPDNGMHYELFDGELIALPPPKSGHSLIAHRIYRLLDAVAAQRQWGKVFIEAGHKIFRDDRFWIQPDVSVLRQDRLKDIAEDAYFEGAPDLVVEVASPSETTRDLMRKAHACLAAGSAAVWIVHPKRREVQVLSASGESSTLSHADIISLPELFPGWSIKVASLFEDVPPANS